MIYTFGNTVLDEHRRALYRGADWIMVEPKVFDVLLYLVKNRNRVVTRQELLEACWPNIYVSDGTLSRCVSRVRQAIDQPRSASQPIFTLHGKGYRFVDQVTVRESREAGPESDTNPEAASVKPAAATLAERRVISVVDCALDFHGGRGGTDAETLYDAMEQFGEICREVAKRYGGSHVTPTCEGMELRFGECSTVERAAESAVFAGFELIERSRDLGLTARVGVASGRAIVKPTGEAGGRWGLVVEIDPLRPASLRASAAPNRCVADSSTLRLVEETFDGRPLGEAQVLGSVVQIFELSPRRKQRTPASDDMPFFGRSSELAFLEHCWRYAAGGQGQTVNVRGAMGVGKTRLVEELAERARVPVDAQLRLQCSPHHTMTPFYPFTLALRDLLEQLELAEADHLPALTPLLAALPSLRKAPLLELGDAAQAEAALEALVSLILAATAARPSIVWVDDVQWIDSTSMKVIEGIRARSSRSKLLVILSGRPDATTGHGKSSGATTIVLNPFSQSELRRYLSTWCDGPALSAQAIDRLVDRSDGVPLFLREILRTTVEQGGSAERSPVPESLQWRLQALLDDAGEAKQVAQWAALLGRNFSRAVLASIAEIPEESLESALEHLTAVGLLSEGGCGKSTSFRFTHSLVHDFAYDSMLGRQRRERHRRIAESVIAALPHVAARDPEFVARQFEASDMPERAGEYWQHARRVARGPGQAEAATGGGLELLAELTAVGSHGKTSSGARRQVA